MFQYILAAVVAASPALAGVTDIYKSLRGDHDVNVTYPVNLDRPDRLVPLSVRVTWPDGSSLTIDDVATNQFLTIERP